MGTAQKLFGAGLASLASGNLLPLGAAIVSELFAERPPPPALCYSELNPLGVEITGTGELASWWWNGAPFSLDNSGPTYEGGGPIGGWIVEAENAPEELSCDSEYPWSATLPFRELWSYVSSVPLPRGEGGPLPEDRRQLARAVAIASWRVLGPALALERYKLETTPIIARIVSQRPEDAAAIESFYGGRIIDGSWHWGDETIGGVPVRDWPRWIPLDSEDVLLRRIYLRAWKCCRLDDRGLEVLSSLSDRTGADDEDAREANEIVIAAARARGDGTAFRASVGMFSFSFGKIDSAVDRLAPIASRLQRQGTPRDEIQSEGLKIASGHSWIWILIPVPVAVGLWVVFRRRPKKNKRKR